MVTPRTEKAYEKHAWTLLFAIGIFGLLVSSFEGLGNPLDPGAVRGITGMSWEEIVTSTPGVARFISEVIRMSSLFQLGWSLLGTLIAAIPYRKGESWAWYVSWYTPILFAIIATRLLIFGGIVWPLFILLLIVSLLGLLLPYRKFFPRKQP